MSKTTEMLENLFLLEFPFHMIYIYLESTKVTSHQALVQHQRLRRVRYK